MPPLLPLLRSARNAQLEAQLADLAARDPNAAWSSPWVMCCLAPRILSPLIEGIASVQKLAKVLDLTHNVTMPVRRFADQRGHSALQTRCCQNVVPTRCSTLLDMG